MKKMTLVLWAAIAAFGMTIVAESTAVYAQAQIKRVRCTVTPREDINGNPFMGVQIKVNINDVIDYVADGPDHLDGGVNVWALSDPDVVGLGLRLPVRLTSSTHYGITPVDAEIDPGASLEWDSLYDPLNPDPLQVDPILDIADDFAHIDENVTVMLTGWWADPDDLTAPAVLMTSTKSGTCVDGGTSQRFKQDTRCDKNADRPGCAGFVATVEKAQYEGGKGWNIQGLANGGDSVAVDLHSSGGGFMGTVANVTASDDGKWSYKGDGGVTPVDGDTLRLTTALGTVPGFSISIK